MVTVPTEAAMLMPVMAEIKTLPVLPSVVETREPPFDCITKLLKYELMLRVVLMVATSN